jgi:hypothetical protein
MSKLGLGFKTSVVRTDNTLTLWCGKQY